MGGARRVFRGVVAHQVRDADGSDLDAEDGQYLAQPHGDSEATGGDREGQGEGTFDAHASRSVGVRPCRRPRTDRGDRRLAIMRSSVGVTGTAMVAHGCVPLTTLTSRPVPREAVGSRSAPRASAKAGMTSRP